MDFFDQLRERFRDRVPRRMHRCFMTGKQCIFCSPTAVTAGMDTSDTQDSVFIIMPFRPNLNTFYEWSLKRYLKGSGINEENVRRADQYPDIGYVMCEKICRPIQEAALVVVDLSLPNPNVYYELGMSVGLDKPLLVLCEAQIFNDPKTNPWVPLGIDRQSVVPYPNVGHLDAKQHGILDSVTRVAVEPRQTQMEIVALLTPDAVGAADGRKKEDIDVGFREALAAAVGVAIDDIRQEARPADSADEETPGPLKAAVQTLDDEELDRLAACHLQDLYSHLPQEIHTYPPKDSPNLSPEPTPLAYQDIAKKVNSCFACIVDLGDESPLSYFWLGYCHARNINVIPVYREKASPNKATRPDAAQQAGSPQVQVQERQEHILAFDIRALWYMLYREGEPQELAGAMRSAIEELLAKDVTTQQRRVLWQRLMRTGGVHIYTGAVHHPELNREVVGDWDLRAVSELVQYLASAEESVVPVFERPIYALETIRDLKLEGQVEWTDEYTSKYVELVRDELANKSCLILASADVNPMTEVVLAYAYGRGGAGEIPACFSEPSITSDEDRIVVALKAPGSKQQLVRRFSRTKVKGKPIKKQERGFLVDNKRILLPYLSQDEAVEPFSVLGHLVVMHNPFSQEPANDVIIVLNGVSGPGTYGLAEMLTGGRTATKARASENLLKKINRSWDENVGNGHQYKGIEAIVEVRISPPKPPTSTAADGEENQDTQEAAPDRRQPDPKKEAVKDKFYDKRRVDKWNLSEDPDIRMGNPRPFPS